MSPKLEAITKAKQGAELLVSDLKEAYRLACDGTPVHLEFILKDALNDVDRIRLRLAEMERQMS